jgi:hypothetical protein
VPGRAQAKGGVHGERKHRPQYCRS